MFAATTTDVRAGGSSTGRERLSAPTCPDDAGVDRCIRSRAWRAASCTSVPCSTPGRTAGAGREPSWD